MNSLTEFIKEGLGPYATELTGDPIEDGYIVVANMLDSNKKSANLGPEFKNGVLKIKVLKGDYDENYITLNSKFKNTFDKTVKQFSVKRIQILKNSGVNLIYLPEVVEGVDIDAPDYDIAVEVNPGFKGATVVSNTNIRCRDFRIADWNGKTIIDKTDIECAGNFKVIETKTLSFIKPSCRIRANVLGVNEIKKDIRKELISMSVETDPGAFADCDVQSLLQLDTRGTWNKIVIGFGRKFGCAVFTRNGTTVLGDHGAEFQLADGWTLTFCKNDKDRVPMLRE